MNERILELLREAGFCFWEDEEWGLGPNQFDWASQYTDEMNKFITLLLQDVMNLFGDERLSLHYLEQPCCEDAVYLLQSKIKERFGIK